MNPDTSFSLLLLFGEDEQETLYDINALCIKVFYTSITTNEVYVLHSERVIKDAPTAQIYVQGEERCLITGNTPLQAIVYNEETKRFRLINSSETYDLQLLPISSSQGDKTADLWYDSDSNMLTIDYRPAYNTQEIPVNAEIKVSKLDGDKQACLGVVKSSKTYRQEQKKIIYKEPASTKIVTHVDWEDQELATVTPFVANTIWLQINTDYWHDSRLRSKYSQIDTDTQSFMIPGYAPYYGDGGSAPKSYFDVVTKEIIEPITFNTAVADTLEHFYNRFFDISQAQINPDDTDKDKRNKYRQCTLRGVASEVEYQKPETIETVYKAGDNEIHTQLQVFLTEKPDNMQYAQTGQQLAIQLQGIIVAPLLSNLIKHNGFYYGIGKVIADKKETYKVFRTAIGGKINSWYDKTTQKYCFSDITGFFGRGSVPIALKGFQNSLYVVGTRETQVWETTNKPAGAVAFDKKRDIIAPQPVRVFARHITSLPVGVANKNLFFERDNYLTFVTESGIININPYTLNNIPQIIRTDIFKGFLSTRSQTVDTATKLYKSFVYTHPDYSFIKPTANGEGVFFKYLPNDQFSVSYFTSDILTNTLLVQNSGEDLIIAKFLQNNKKLIFYRYRHNEHVYFDNTKDKKKAINFKWAVQFKPNGGYWDNHKICLQMETLISTPLEVNISLSNIHLRKKKLEKTITFEPTGERLPDTNYGQDFFFSGFKHTSLTPARFLIESGLLEVSGATTQPVEIIKATLYGESLSLTY